jgi:hypothetical protein
MSVHNKFDIEAMLEAMDTIEFDSDQGFGSITPDDAGPDISV